jgi:hypothetical protein
MGRFAFFGQYQKLGAAAADLVSGTSRVGDLSFNVGPGAVALGDFQQCAQIQCNSCAVGISGVWYCCGCYKETVRTFLLCVNAHTLLYRASIANIRMSCITASPSEILLRF